MRQTACMIFGQIMVDSIASLFNSTRVSRASDKMTALSQSVLEGLFVLKFYGPVSPMGSCRARSVYLSTLLLGRLSF